MSDAIDRAAEIMLDGDPGLSLVERLRAAKALDAAGLLATPEHDAAVAAKVLAGFEVERATSWETGEVDYRRLIGPWELAPDD